MSWEFMIEAYGPRHAPVRPLLDDGRALPAPGTGPHPTAAELVAVLAVAGLRGQLGFETPGLELPRYDWDTSDDHRSADLGTVYLSGGPGPDRADAPIHRITLYKPGESTLAATLAVRRLVGAVIVLADDDDLGDGLPLVRPDDDPAALAEVWPWP